MMTCGLHRFIKFSSRKWIQVFLAISWFGGLLCGCLLFDHSGSMTLLMEQAASLGVSLRNLMIANGIPFLFSAFAMYIRKPELLPALAFFKGCMFACVSMGALVAFGSAGWLVRLLLMFSDLFLTGLLYYCWLRCISGFGRFSCLRCGAVAALVFLVVTIDYCWIAPILVGIL
jgi:hypothetical protein